MAVLCSYCSVLDEYIKIGSISKYNVNKIMHAVNNMDYWLFKVFFNVTKFSLQI